MIRLPNLKQISCPATVEEAGGILSDSSRKAAVIGGGITYSFGSNPKIEELVSIAGLGLDYIKRKKGGLAVGAGTRVADLISNRSVRDYAGGLLTRVSTRIGSSLNRNLITIGGNIMQPFIWCDLPSAFMALKGTIITAGCDARAIKADDFFSRHPRRQLAPGEIVVEVDFPALGPRTRCAFLDFTLTENDFAFIKVAGIARLEAGRCKSLSLVVGGATALPQRATGAEKLLEGKKITNSLISRAAKTTAEEIKLVKDIRCTSKYKRSLCGVLVSDILKELLLGKKVGR